MARPRKPTPLNQSQITNKVINPPYLDNTARDVQETLFSQNRGENLSMRGDKVKTVSVGIQDIDEAVIYYFNNIIKPTVIQDGNRIAVKAIYASPERWKSVQADGFYRDGNGQTAVPLIVFKRDNIEKVRTLGNKLDGNFAALYQVIGTKYNSRNQYDKFSILNNRIPSEQYYLSVVPDYVTVSYSCIVFTNFVEQNNKIIEAIEYASDSYWGDLNRWRFKATIDSFATTTLIENGLDRAAKSTFNIKLNGYLIPDTVNRDLTDARNKFYTKSQVIFDLEVVDAGSTTNDIERMKFANKAPAANSLAATSFIGGGVNVTNNNTYISTATSGDLTYLNTNKTLQATSVTAPNSATFTGSILQPPEGSTLPSTTVNNFTFYINGQYVPSSLVTFGIGMGTVTAVFDTTNLGYTLETDDEIIAIGKWQ